MAISFTRAEEVAAGDSITSSQLEALADAFNSRLRSGIADGTFRIHQWFFNLFRSIRNPSSTGAFPAQGEFFEFYSHLDPDSGTGWPDAEAGEHEGANLGNPMAAFVFGNDNVMSEAERLVFALPIGIGSGDDVDELIWNHGKQQRGAYDPTTGAQAANAFIAAQSFFRVTQPQANFVNTSYGGFQPTPKFLGSCGGGTLREDLEYKFTAIVAEPDASQITNGTISGASGTQVVTYPGSCFDPGDVSSVARTPFAYYVFLNSGAWDRLPISDWLEGPYSGGGRLTRPAGGQLSHCLNAFLHDFRGTDADRNNDTVDILNFGFDFEAFFSSQYFLAPNLAHVDGGNLIVDYPWFEFSGATTHAAGSLSAEHTLADGFVAGVVFAKAIGLAEKTNLEVLENGTVVSTLELTPEAPGKMATIRNPTAGATIQIRLAEAANLTSSAGFIGIETTEQIEYKPGIHDAYLYLRLKATDGEPTPYVDGSGIGLSDPKRYSDDYFEFGSIINARASAPHGTADDITVNPIFQAARRLAESNVRIVNRHQLLGYAVEDGKSVLWFKSESLGNEYADAFKGIAGDVEDEEGILPTAPAGGWSNEWLMFTQEFGYHQSESSTWKLDTYADYFTFGNRCILYNPRQISRSLNQHIQQTVAPPILAAEAPSGYNYLETLNDPTYASENKADFYKSCQIYKPDEEIESATWTTEGGIKVVKLVFKKRIHHCAGIAPASIGRDVGTWDVSALHSEPYRTTENAIREYLISTGSNCSQAMAGNAALGNSLYSQPDDPHGSCVPRFFFTRMVPKPYRDDNDTLEASDSVFAAGIMPQMAVYLRAMCEGYVDGQTSEQYSCETLEASLYDFTFENLIYQADGGRWLHILPDDIRPDLAEGFGPLPNTVAYASSFNRIARAINLLDKARIELPLVVKFKQTIWEGTDALTTGDLDHSNGGCVGDSNEAVYSGDASALSITFESNWFTAGAGESFTVSAETAFTGDWCDSGDYTLTATKQKYEYRHEPLNEDLANAIPESWRDMIGGQHVGFLAWYNSTSITFSQRDTTDSSEAFQCCGSGSPPCPAFEPTPGNYLAMDQETIESVDECRLFTGGVLESGDPPAGVVSRKTMPNPSTGGIYSCGTSPSTTRGFEIIGEQLTPFIQIPLTDAV